MKKRYNDIGTFLKEKFGCKVYKVSLKADFTCPNRDGTKGFGGCIYCNPEILTPQTYFEGMSIKSQLAEGVTFLKKKYNAEKFIAYLQSYTNTYGPIEKLETLYNEAVNYPDVIGLAVSTRPDCIDDGVVSKLSLIGKEKFVWVELGLQTSKDRTLELINRGHGLADFLRAYENIVLAGIPVCVHVIMGLPGETKGEMLDTAKLLGKLQVWGVKIHHLEVQRGTKLAEMYGNGDVKLLSFEEYTALVVQFIEQLHPTTLIHRLCSDTPLQYLVAPRWEGGKFRLLREVDSLMAKRDACQGDRWGDSSN